MNDFTFVQKNKKIKWILRKVVNLSDLYCTLSNKSYFPTECLVSKSPYLNLADIDVVQHICSWPLWTPWVPCWRCRVHFSNSYPITCHPWAPDSFIHFLCVLQPIQGRENLSRLFLTRKQDTAWTLNTMHSVTSVTRHSMGKLDTSVWSIKTRTLWLLGDCTHHPIWMLNKFNNFFLQIGAFKARA